ncbi:HAD-IIA family hydrolase [Tropicimonas aquimaris]|uniref:HAD-IIA family hydrolase n=1 Tax=Tropicimonas aquimaris TaxID=914152 RepID=A0ABW3IRA5_9RHOB
MIRLTSAEAFEAYERARSRLPVPRQSSAAPVEAATLAEIADRFDVLLLDAYGVLNIGNSAIPGTAERIEALRRSGKRVLVVSNAASLTQQDLGEKYHRLGYDFDVADIVSSRAALAVALEAQPPRCWGVMAPPETRLDDLRSARMIPLGDDPAAYAEADGFLLVGSDGWTEARQAVLEDSLRAAPRPLLVANPDIIAPRDEGFSAEPGYFAHRIADRLGIEPAFYGKPFANIYDLALARIGREVPPSRVLMVGDSLHTDILGAQTVGVASALVAEFGFFEGLDIPNAIARTAIVPDFIIRRP